MNSSVLLTPEKTPTKDEVSTKVCLSVEKSVSCRNQNSKLHVKQLNSDGESVDDADCDCERLRGKNLNRSYSDSALDSPKPTNAKVIRSQKTSATTESDSGMLPKRRQKKASALEKKKTENTNHLLTEYFPVRRSSRVPRSQLKKQQQSDLEEAIVSQCEDGLKVVELPGKGRGVVATKSFKRGDFVVEYAGDLIEITNAKQRERDYSTNSMIGCYMYYFKYNNKTFCIDATKETGKLGRLLNHSRWSFNCMTRVVAIKNKPFLIIVAARDIQVDEELLYDYGDRSKSSLEAHPWLAT